MELTPSFLDERPTLDAIQWEAIERIFEAWDSGRKGTFLNMATGTGKTFTAAKFIKRSLAEKPGRILFLVYQEELIEQAFDEFTGAGLHCAIEKAERSAKDAVFHPLGGVDVVIGSKDTLQKGRLQEWPRDTFRVVVADEAHLSLAPSWLTTLRHFGAEFSLFLTATAFRMDGQELYGVPGSLAEDAGSRSPYPMEGLPDGTSVPTAIAFKYPILSAIRNGHLSPITDVTCPLKIDLKNIRTTGKNKDFSREALERRINDNLGPIVQAGVQEMERRDIDQMFAAFPDVGSAISAAKMFAAHGISAEAVYSDSPKHPKIDRDGIVKGFKGGDFRVICFNNLLTTGVNHRPAHLFDVRPTKSLVVKTQLIGRATRRFPGIPMKYIVNCGWTGCDGVMTTADVFLEDQDEKVKTAARKLARVGKVYDPTKLLEKAEEMVEKQEQARVRAEIEVKVKKERLDYKAIEFTPVNAGRLLGIPDLMRDVAAAKLEPPTEAQADLARQYGLKDVSGLPRPEVQRLLDECLDRELRKVALPEQVAELVKRGHSEEVARVMSQNKAVDELRKPLGPTDAQRAFLLKQRVPAHEIDRMTRQQATDKFLEFKRRWAR